MEKKIHRDNGNNSMIKQVPLHGKFSLLSSNGKHLETGDLLSINSLLE